MLSNSISLSKNTPIKKEKKRKKKWNKNNTKMKNLVQN